MKKFIHLAAVIYLALIILIRMMAMPISLMEYSLNRNFIAENLCENKAKSEMHCAGKCFLSKKLAKSADTQDTQNQKGGSKITVVDYCESFDDPSFPLNLGNHLPNAFLRATDIEEEKQLPSFALRLLSRFPDPVKHFINIFLIMNYFGQWPSGKSGPYYIS